MSGSKLITTIKLSCIAALTLCLTACDSSNAVEQTQVIKPVKLYQIPRLKERESDVFLAEVDAGNRSHLSFQVSGVIEQLKVKQGQRVQKGQLLVSLDPTDFQLAVDAAQAEFDFYEANYKRDQRLFKKKLISIHDYDKAETDFKTASANLEQAHTDLSYTQIEAPFDGVISLSFVKKHQFINAKETVLNIINSDKLDINIALPVPYVDEVGVTNLQQFKFAVSFDLNNQIKMPAKFKEMSTQPDPDTNSYKATLEVIRPGAMNILTGMTGQVYIYREQQAHKLVLPESAWEKRTASTGSLWRLDPSNNSVHLISVSIDKDGAVVDGLQAGDLIVTAGIHELYEGQVVRPWQREEGI